MPGGRGSPPKKPKRTPKKAVAGKLVNLRSDLNSQLARLQVRIRATADPVARKKLHQMEKTLRIRIQHLK